MAYLSFQMFEREAMAWARLRHPHILEFLGTFQRYGFLYLVSPFMENGSLIRYIIAHPEVDRIKLLCEIADAVAYLHEEGVIHGDLRGENILIDENIHCLLCDFGLAKMETSNTATALKGAGTFRWQSPELWNEEPKSFSSDAYAFAMTIVEVLTGKAPFADVRNERAFMYKIKDKDERPPKVPSVSLSGVSYKGTWEVAEGCWSRDPKDRIPMSAAFQRLRVESTLQQVDEDQIHWSHGSDRSYNVAFQTEKTDLSSIQDDIGSPASSPDSALRASSQAESKDGLSSLTRFENPSALEDLRTKSGYVLRNVRQESSRVQSASPPADHALFRTPPESFDQPSQNSSFPLDDIGSFITSISRAPFQIDGSYCDVFEGFHSTAGKVVLKRPRMGGTEEDEGLIRRLEREAMTWRSLQHPHILMFLGTFKRGKHLYLVSPFVDNGNLVEYIAVYPQVNRVRLLSETADALNYLHQNGVVHGDIKGTNILIDNDGRCLVYDFDQAKMAHSRTFSWMKGVAAYRWQAPELWHEDASKSFSSDTYAFAITIAEVLTGEVPFPSLMNHLSVMFAILSHDERPQKEPAESLSGASYKNTWEVAEACWSKIPEERISMAVAFERLRADPSLA